MAKKKQLSIEQRARIDILAAEGFSQRSIAKKLGISKLENSRGGLKLLACSVYILRSIKKKMLIIFFD